MLRNRVLSVALTAALLAACQAPTANRPGATGTKAGPRAGVAGATPPAGLATGTNPGTGTGFGIPSTPRPVPDGPSPLKPPTVPAIVSANGATLTGKVKAPSTFVSDQGGGLISEQGGGVVSNQGGSVISNQGGSAVSGSAGGYRLHAIAQLPLAGARVHLTDAAGRSITDPVTGKPLEAIAAADGTYAFTAALPANNLVVEVVLPGGKGTLRAIAPPDAAARGQTDVELVGTLTTGYVLEKFVRSQTFDAQLTLDKLPAAVERDTRAKAEAALESGQAAGKVVLPTVLTDASAVATIEALRQADGTFDSQMETVKNLLVAAGLSDLGAGRLATDVWLPPLIDAVQAADGTVFFAASGEDRVWQVGADGRMVVAAGIGPSMGNFGAADITGKLGPEIKLGSIQSLTLAPDGALVILEHNRVSRLGVDGRMSVLTKGLPATGALMSSLKLYTDGSLKVFVRPVITTEHPANRREPDRLVLKTPAAVWRIAPSGEAARVAELDATASMRLHIVTRLTPMGADQLAVSAIDEGTPEAKKWESRHYLLDLTTGALTDAPAPSSTELVDDTGGRWQNGAGGLTPVGGGTKLAVPEGVYIGSDTRLRRLADGGLLMIADGRLYRCAPGAATLVAGLAKPPREATAAEIQFQTPALLAADSKGAIRVYDEGSTFIWSIVPGDRGRVVTEVPAYFPEQVSDGYDGTIDGPRVEVKALRATADGATWILSGDPYSARILRVGADGVWSVVWSTEDGQAPWDPDGENTFVQNELSDFLVADDGTLTLLLGVSDGATLEVRRPGQAPVRSLISGPMNGFEFSVDRLAMAPGGGYYLANFMTLWRWKPGGVPELATAEFDSEWYGHYYGRNTRLASDPGGRLYGFDNSGIWRYDPATMTYSAIAGYDGEYFKDADVNNGTGNDVLAPAVDAAGNLYFLDPSNRQVKRLPAADLR